MSKTDPFTEHSPSPDRLLSLDFFRGFTMLLLIAEGTYLFSILIDPSLKNSILHALGTQFHHHPWNGLRFWDLIQPFFMFIVGVALPFSVRNRERQGEAPSRIRNHALQRSFSFSSSAGPCTVSDREGLPSVFRTSWPSWRSPISLRFSS